MPGVVCEDKEDRQWSAEEARVIEQTRLLIGNRWKDIGNAMGRSEHSVRNKYNRERNKCKRKKKKNVHFLLTFPFPQEQWFVDVGERWPPSPRE
jgi:hypothetical protein